MLTYKPKDMVNACVCHIEYSSYKLGQQAKPIAIADHVLLLVGAFRGKEWSSK